MGIASGETIILLYSDYIYTDSATLGMNAGLGRKHTLYQQTASKLSEWLVPVSHSITLQTSERGEMLF